MRFPKYKIHSLVGQFKGRLARHEFLEESGNRMTTWGYSAAYNCNRILRIANLDLKESNASPWRQIMLHEVRYFETRYRTYSDRWQKSYERANFALCRLKNDNNEGKYSLWQIVSFSETARFNLNYRRASGKSLFGRSAENWDKAYSLSAWILRHKPLPNREYLSLWDLTFASISRDTFRSRRFEWDACAKRAAENFTLAANL